MIYASVTINKNLVKLYKISPENQWTSIGSYHTEAHAAERAEHLLQFDAEEGSYFHYREGSISGFPRIPSHKFTTGPVGI